MKTFKETAVQGDLYIRRISVLPTALKTQSPTGGFYILAHSETGHHHVVDADDVQYYVNPSDSMTAYLVVQTALGKMLRHERPFDTHEPIHIPPGTYELRRQREYVPEGWKRVDD